MKVTVLSDNIGCGALKGEWGLAFHIEFGGKKYLLDTGGSDLFLTNAKLLGIDISEVDCAVLSHAHYDHSLGIEPFFRTNAKADFFISPNAHENCYGGLGFLSKYIGIPKGILAAYKDRIRTPQDLTEIDKDVFVVPHSTIGLSVTGRKAHLYVRRGWRYIPDDFSHEQSLVFRTGNGLVIFNSCSHSGADVVMEEVGRAFPSENVIAYLGGLHLFRMNDGEVREIADKIKNAGIKKVITGHCTGERAFAVLKSCLGDAVEQFRCGMIIELDEEGKPALASIKKEQMTEVNPEILSYLNEEIIPQYRAFDSAHTEDHVLAVLESALAMSRHYDVNTDMIAVAAAFHDLGVREDRETHHLISGRIIRETTQLRRWFSESQIEAIAQAAEDHRASSNHEPRSIYGKIIAEADRQIDPETVIRRTIQFSLAHYPALDKEGHWHRTLEHLHEKYADGGYLKLWIPQSPNAERLESLRETIRDEKRLRSIFEEIYKQES